jgi:hypothetical protein
MHISVYVYTSIRLVVVVVVGVYYKYKYCKWWTLGAPGRATGIVYVYFIICIHQYMYLSVGHATWFKKIQRRLIQIPKPKVPFRKAPPYSL